MANKIVLPSPGQIARGIASGGVGITQPGPTVSGATGAAEKAATAVPDFISRLTSGNLWLRIGEVGLGIALIIVGLGKLTGTTTELVKAGKAAAAIK